MTQRQVSGAGFRWSTTFCPFADVQRRRCGSSFARTVVTTAANVLEVTQAGALLHGEEKVAFGRCRAHPGGRRRIGIVGMRRPAADAAPSADRCRLLRRGASLRMSHPVGAAIHRCALNDVGARQVVAAANGGLSAAGAAFLRRDDTLRAETEIDVSAGFAAVADSNARGVGRRDGGIGVQEEVVAQGSGLASLASTRSPIRRLVSSRSIAEPSRRVKFGT